MKKHMNKYNIHRDLTQKNVRIFALFGLGLEERPHFCFVWLGLCILYTIACTMTHLSTNNTSLHPTHIDIKYVLSVH
jgi:hypothetical protein